MNHHLRSTFNFFGYFAIYIQWMWVLALFVPMLAKSDVLKPTPTQSAATASALQLPELPHALTLGLSILITILVIALVVYALMKGPGPAVESVDTATSKLADNIVPLVTHHKKISQKRRAVLNQRLVFIIKIASSFLAFLALFATYAISPSISYGVIFAIGFMLLPWPLVWFSLVYLLQPSTKTK